MEKPLVDNRYLLERFQAKGGWTYARIPQIPQDKRSPFGWVRVRGTIDDFEIKNCNLMPMGNGKLFLPVKADIRKKIGKKEGDYVRVILFEDNSPVEIPEELRLCLLDEPVAYKTFLSYTMAEQKAFVEWIYAAKKKETKANRIVKTISKLQKGQKLTEQIFKRNE
ncbi:MAG: YdeI/OmpD-associated family protein [Ferruginibacter sp.]